MQHDGNDLALVISFEVQLCIHHFQKEAIRLPGEHGESRLSGELCEKLAVARLDGNDGARRELVAANIILQHIRLEFDRRANLHTLVVGDTRSFCDLLSLEERQAPGDTGCAAIEYDTNAGRGIDEFILAGRRQGERPLTCRLAE